MMPVITLPTMKKALMNTFGSRLSDAEASRMAEFVMNFFGYGDRILDNFLESTDRNVFYMLEDEGLVQTSQEEIVVNMGQRWRLNFWILKKSTILHRAESIDPREDPTTTVQRLYEDLWRSLSADKDEPLLQEV